MVLLETLWLNSPLSVLSRGDASLTVTDSDAEPTSSMTSTRKVCATVSTWFCRTNFLNPGTVTVNS